MSNVDFSEKMFASGNMAGQGNSVGQEHGHDEHKDNEGNGHGPNPPQMVEILLNGKLLMVVRGAVYSYDTLVYMAFPDVQTNPDVSYTITYWQGNHGKQGILVSGQTLSIEGRVSINVVKTNRS